MHQDCLSGLLWQCRQIPIGVLYDMLAEEELPWSLTVRCATVFQDHDVLVRAAIREGEFCFNQAVSGNSQTRLPAPGLHNPPCLLPIG